MRPLMESALISWTRRLYALFLLAMALFSLAAVLAGRAGAEEGSYTRRASVRFLEIRTDAFPRLDLFLSIRTPSRIDWRYLGRRNFRVTEEEVPIRDFSVEPYAPPLAMALVIDDSGSLRGLTPVLRRTLHRLVEELSPFDRCCVIGFERRVEELAPLTSDKRKLHAAVGRISSYGATSLFDALCHACSVLSKAPRGSVRAIVLLSDGIDQEYPGGPRKSSAAVQEAVSCARRAGVEIHTIAAGPHADADLLERLASATGGYAYRLFSPKRTRELFDRLTRRARSKVHISYVSPDLREDRKPRAVRVDLVLRGRPAAWCVDRYIPPRVKHSAAVMVKRKRKPASGLSSLRIFTTGENGRRLQCSFSLWRLDGRKPPVLVRCGLTTRDGRGRLEHGTKGILRELPPGGYVLELSVPGEPVGYRFPLEIGPDEEKIFEKPFSLLVFRRSGRPWYDTPTPYGGTSEMLTLELEDLRTGKRLYEGLLASFKRPDGICLHLPEGDYRIVLDDRWPVRPGKGIQYAVLRNRMEATIQVSGGDRLYFDVEESDFKHPRRFAAVEAPETREDTAVLRSYGRRSRQETASEYLQGRFSRHRTASGEDEGLYRPVDAERVRRRLASLYRRHRIGEEPKASAFGRADTRPAPPYLDDDSWRRVVYRRVLERYGIDSHDTEDGTEEGEAER